MNITSARGNTVEINKQDIIQLIDGRKVRVSDISDVAGDDMFRGVDPESGKHADTEGHWFHSWDVDYKL